MSDWTTIQHEQSGLVMVPLHHAERVRDERDRLKADIAELKEWLESALSVLSGIDLQAVGKELNLPLGAAISPAILPGIRALKARIAALESGILEHWQESTHGVTANMRFADSKLHALIDR